MDAKERAIEFGKRLRSVRDKSGDSLRKIEERSGLNSGYLSQLENGKITHPSPSVLQKVAVGYELRFSDLLKWTGYVEETEQPVGTNQAVAFSSVAGLGEPSDEELRALKAIVDVLKQQRKAGFALPGGDDPLDPETARLVRGYAMALLREADALGARPTPLEDVRAAARLVLSGELSLDVKDKESLRERFGHWVDKAWQRLQGSFDFRTQEIWVKSDLHPSKRRFVISHEIGHAIIPAHRQSFAYIDDKDRMPPFARELFEREANQAAIEILMQGGEAGEEFDSSPPGMDEICRIADSFGASIVATARYVVENSRRPVALVVCHSGGGPRLGPPHVYCSQNFERAFGWRAGAAPWERLLPALQTAAAETEESWIASDLNKQGRMLRVERKNTGYAVLVLVAGESRLRSVGRLLLPGRAASAAG